MKRLRRHRGLAAVAAFAAFVMLPALVMAGPRTGGSFGGRGGFRSSGGASRVGGYGRSTGRGGGPIIVTPGFGWGWGWGPFGWGGGFSLFGTLLTVAVVGGAAIAVSRAVRRARANHPDCFDEGHDDEGEVVAMPGRGYVYKVQLGLGRSARGIRDRLAKFAAEGDTASEAGLARLLQQTAVELLRERDSIRHAGAESAGPMSLTNAETKMNAAALGERSRFQVERVRGADGQVRRSEVADEEAKEALEYVMVSLVVATRSPLPLVKQPEQRADVEAMLSELGGVSPNALLGLEVIWTPADPGDALTETDLMTTYPTLRSV